MPFFACEHVWQKRRSKPLLYRGDVCFSCGHAISLLFRKENGCDWIWKYHYIGRGGLWSPAFDSGIAPTVSFLLIPRGAAHDFHKFRGTIFPCCGL